VLPDLPLERAGRMPPSHQRGQGRDYGNAQVRAAEVYLVVRVQGVLMTAMNVKIVQLDGPMMNLALSKLARHHANKGDKVSFDEPNPDIIYYGAIFDWTVQKWRNQSTLGNAKVVVGGYPFNDDQLSSEVDALMPLYDLWGTDYSMGYTSRGCIRKCGFCIVPIKEGAIRDYQSVSQFHDPRHKKVILLDNNFFASPKWRENLAYINDNGLKVDFTQGLDLRLMTEEMAGQLASTKLDGQIHFAFDSISEEPSVRRGLALVISAGVRPEYISVYVLVGYDSTWTEDVRRCSVLWDEYKVHPFVMKYNGKRDDPKLNALARWANRPAIHRNHSLPDYLASRGLAVGRER